MSTVMEHPEVRDEDDGPAVGLVDLLTWVGDGKRIIAAVTGVAAAAGLAAALLLAPSFTALSTLLPPGSQQQSSSAAALAALGSLGGIAGGLSAKTPDELYIALMKSDSVQRELAEKFDLATRWSVKTQAQLRRAFPGYVRIASDKKSGLISVEVDDKDAKFAADLANAYPAEITKVLSRLAVSEAQQRRAFFQQQISETKENLVKAEQGLQTVQERSGMIVLDKQSEAIIEGAATLRAQILEREVQLKVLRVSATEQNPDVQRLNSELRALRAELGRMESNQNGNSTVDLPMGKIPQASIDFIRARRELKLQETLLESMVRQFEVAKLDEAKEGPQLQVVDAAVPPDYKSKPSRLLIVLGSAFAGLLLSSLWVIGRRYAAACREHDPESTAAWSSLARAWRWRRG